MYFAGMARTGVAVIGGGTWGLALAAAVARARTSAGAKAGANGNEPTLLFSRRAAKGDHALALPAGVAPVHDMAEVGARARLVLLAVPSSVAREVLRALGDHLDGSHYVVHGVRGLAGDAMDTIADVVRQETPVRRVGALGGPALAGDLLESRPSVMVCGSQYPEVNAAVQEAFTSPSLRLYTTDDLRGLEWASALVGCLAIGVGYAQGVGLGAGLSAAMIARSIQEAARLAAAAGGDERTLLGLAGYGDLLASIEQKERPEVLLGEALARGKSLSDALVESKQRVEAVELIPRVAAWAERLGVRAPIFTALTKGVISSQSRSADTIIRELMTGPVEDRA
jgi:glycerol-3-phosphate dehydrogenase (NAD(P)+)